MSEGVVYNGMPATALGEGGWVCPWSGTSGGNCLEAKRLADGRVAMRQSTDPAGPALIYSRVGFSAFIRATKSGDADFLLED